MAVSRNKVLKYYGLDTFSTTTAWRWMRTLGMHYCDTKKNYYVDGREWMDVVLYRWEFVKEHLQRELIMFRWIPISYDAEKKLEDGNEILLDSG